jgi:hypothetical protein
MKLLSEGYIQGDGIYKIQMFHKYVRCGIILCESLGMRVWIHKATVISCGKMTGHELYPAICAFIGFQMNFLSIVIKPLPNDCLSCYSGFSGQR